MAILCKEAKELKDKFLSFKINHVPRVPSLSFSLLYLYLQIGFCRGMRCGGFSPWFCETRHETKMYLHAVLTTYYVIFTILDYDSPYLYFSFLFDPFTNNIFF